MKPSCLALRKCIFECWFVAVVAWEYTWLLLLFMTSVLVEHCNPLKLRLIGDDICHCWWALSFAMAELLIYISISGCAKDTCWLLWLESPAVCSSTPSQSWFEVDRDWVLPEKSLCSDSMWGIDYQVPVCFSVYISIVADERTSSAQWGGTVAVQR